MSKEEKLLPVYILLDKPTLRLYGIWCSMKPQFKLTTEYTKVTKN
jgi:hypothetical protein